MKTKGGVKLQKPTLRQSKSKLKQSIKTTLTVENINAEALIQQKSPTESKKDVLRLIESKALKIAIVGRANVGKSTIFNKLCGGKFAIVKDIAGTTRDAKDYSFTFNNINITITDTAGLENIPSGSLPRFVKKIADVKEALKEASMYEQMIKKSLEAIQQSHITLFIVDGKNGLTNDDIHFAKIAKRFCKNVILLVNKCESDARVKIEYSDLLSLGISEPLYISAEHKIGFIAIYDYIIDFCQRFYEQNPALNNCFEDNTLQSQQGDNENDTGEELNDKTINEEVVVDEDRLSLAIIGRPNAGKSTLVNKIIGVEKLITGDKAGITRDAIALNIKHENYKIKIVDTAGIRKERKKGDELEQLSVEETHRVIRLANVIALVVDAGDPFVTQDLHLAYQACQEGRAVIVVMNKWDKLTKMQQDDTKLALEKVLKDLITDVYNPCVVLTSATKGIGIKKFLNEVVRIYENWNKRIKTPLLNQWLREITEIQRPKMVDGKPTKLKYMTQIKTRPPTFNLFVNRIEGVDRSYLRFLAKRIGKDFSLDSIPIRIKLTKTKNKYV